MNARKPGKKAKSPPASAGGGGLLREQQPPYLSIGQVGRPHGLQGAFFVSGREGAISPAYREVLIGPTLSTAKRAVIAASMVHAGRPVLQCSLAADRTAAGSLTGHLIFADREMIEAQRGDSILWHDLAGAIVYDTEGKVVGRVHHVYNAGASDNIEIRSGERSVDIPLIEQFLNTRKPLTQDEQGQRCLQLKVVAAVFADIWNDQGGRRDEPPLSSGFQGEHEEEDVKVSAGAPGGAVGPGDDGA